MGSAILASAAEFYILYELGQQKPNGIKTTQGMWFPIPLEVEDCCKEIKMPKTYSFSALFKHCQTIKHVAKKYGINAKELRAEIDKRRAFMKINGEWNPKEKVLYESEQIRNIKRFNIEKKEIFDAKKMELKENG